MAHVDQQVRDEVASRITALSAFDRVATNIGDDLRDGDLPAAVVQTPGDTTEDASKGWAGAEPLEKRTIRLVVVLVADAGMDTVDDTLSALRAQVEAAVASDGTLDGIAKEVEHVSADLDVGTTEDGERWYAFLALEWEVEVWTHRGDPETAV